MISPDKINYYFGNNLRKFRESQKVTARKNSLRSVRSAGPIMDALNAVSTASPSKSVH